MYRRANVPRFQRFHRFLNNLRYVSLLNLRVRTFINCQLYLTRRDGFRGVCRVIAVIARIGEQFRLDTLCLQTESQAQSLGRSEALHFMQCQYRSQPRWQSNSSLRQHSRPYKCTPRRVSGSRPQLSLHRLACWCSILIRLRNSPW